LNGEPGLGARESLVYAWLGFAVIVAFGAALVWVALLKHTIGDYGTETDYYGAYAAGARAIQHGVLDPSRYGVVGPIYELALALAGFVTRDLFLAGKLLSVVASIVRLALWFMLWRRLVDARTRKTSVKIRPIDLRRPRRPP
jgi:hypothetical protein